MKGLEAEGFVHLYGLAPVLSALKAGKRDFATREQQDDTRIGGTISSGNDYVDEDADEDDDFNAFMPDRDEDAAAKATKPEAQFTPYLFLQDRPIGGGSGRSGDKQAAAAEVKQLAEERGIPVHYTDKGSLNALSGNRPHQVSTQLDLAFAQ